MPETPDTPDLTPASQNPWYLLMTVCGEQDGEEIDWDLHARNRRIWNGWAAQGLSGDEKQVLIARLPSLEANFAPLTADETAQVEKRFADAGLPLEDIPSPLDGIDLANVRFQEILCAGDFVFLETASFHGAQFSRNAWFMRSSFFGEAVFNGAHFFKNAHFAEARFSLRALFDKVQFDAEAEFAAACFSVSSSFVGARFSGLAIFTLNGRARFNGAHFKTHPLNLYGETQQHDTDWTGAIWPDPPDDRDAATNHRRAYERLKLLMAEQHKFRDEHFFLRKELECKEIEDGFPNNIPSRLYGFLSDYGASIARPVAGLAAVAALGWFLLFAENCYGWKPFSGATCDFLGRGLGLSLSNTFGVFGFARVFHLDTLRGLGAFGQSVSAVQTLLGIILIFLIGLALRNRFRIK